jgi:hypothetical protein
VLSQQRPPAYAAFMTWTRQQGDAAVVVEIMRQRVCASAAGALRGLAHGSSQAPGDVAAAAMLVVVVADTPPEGVSDSAQPPVSVVAWAKALPPGSGIPSAGAKVGVGALWHLALHGALQNAHAHTASTCACPPHCRCSWLARRAPLRSPSTASGS